MKKPLPVDIIQFAQRGGDFSTFPEEFQEYALNVMARFIKEGTDIMDVKAKAEIEKYKEEAKLANERADYWIFQYNEKHGDKEIELAEKIAELMKKDAEKTCQINELKLRVDMLEHPEKYICEEEDFF